MKAGSQAPARPHDRDRSSLAGFGWMAVSALLFASMGFFARVASGHTHWTLIAGTRAAVGAAVAYGVGRARSAPLVVKDRKGIWLRSLYGTGSLLLTFFALGLPALALGDVTTLLNLTPVFIALLAPLLLKERGGKRVLVALPLSVAGVLLLLHPSFVFGGGPPLTGAALVAAGAAVLASFLSANAMILLRKISPFEGPEAIALHFSLVAAAACLVLSIPHLRVPGARDGAAMIASGLSAGLGQLAMTRAYALERAARVSGMGYLSVVVSTALGSLFLNEAPGPAAFTGMLLVVSGGLIVTVAGISNRN